MWDAVNWGEWAVAYGKMAAARQGAADRIRREATIAELIDPKLEGGTPSRVLGRLHDQTPRIPFITGWASQREAVKFLEESYKVDPTNKITLVFLAEALVSDMKRLGPFGHGNRKPLLYCRGLTLAAPPRRCGKTGDHLQLFVRQGNAAMKCIAFNRGELFDRLQPGVTLDLAVEPKINEFNGRTSVELDVKDVRFAP